MADMWALPSEPLVSVLDPDHVAIYGECVCTPEGCDEEGDPGCAYCRALDCEEPCPAEPERPDL